MTTTEVRQKATELARGELTIQTAVFVDHGPQILHDTVHLTGTGRSGQPFRNIMGDIINAHCLCVKGFAGKKHQKEKKNT